MLTEMTQTTQQKLERIFSLEDEIAYAKTCLQPHNTGHINTAISWLNERVRLLKQESEST